MRVQLLPFCCSFLLIQPSTVNGFLTPGACLFCAGTGRTLPVWTLQ
jgi:hypothetical protein